MPVPLLVHEFERVSPQIIERLRAARTPDVANALGPTVICDPGLRPVWKSPRLVGTALTIRVHAGDNLGAALSPLFSRPGDVVVVDTGNDRSHAIVGGLLGRGARISGIAGFIVDGAVRDVEDLERLAVPVFSRTISPRRASKDRPCEIGGSVTCGGVSVAGGDLVIADADGVAFIRAAALDAAVTMIEREIEKEHALDSDEALMAALRKMRDSLDVRSS
jgi:regulator of RNase E activity RraA